MPNIIDSLVVRLALDPAEFLRGKKTADDATRAAKEQAKRTGDEIENAERKRREAAKRGSEEDAKRAKEQAKAQKEVGEAFAATTRKALEFFAVLLGARGVAEFVSHITTADSALGRFARNLDESPQVISAWEMAAERMGGTAEATASTFETVGKALFELHQHGKMLPEDFYRLQAATGKFIDTDHGVSKFLSDTAAALHQLAQVDPSLAHFYASGMGLDTATANMMIKYGASITSYLQGLQKYAPSQETISNLQKLQESWETLTQKVVAFATYVTGKLTPIIKPLLDQLGDWIDKNREWIATGIVKAVQDFANFIRQIDWKSVAAGLDNFATGAKHAADAIGGIKIALEALVALWASSKVVGMLKWLGILGIGSAAVAGAGAVAAGAVAGNTPDAATQSEMNKFYKEHPDKTGVHATIFGMIGDWLHKTFGGTPSGAAYNQAGDLTIDGQPVSKANPLPVRAQNDGTPDGIAATAEGGGWMSAISAAASRAGLSMGGIGSERAPSGGKPGWWTPERQKFAYDYLRKNAGLSDAGAKALVARWAYVEASGGPASRNPRSGAFGIAQWLGSRKAGIAGNTDFTAQLAHAAQELNSTEKRAGDLLRNARTPQEGAVGASAYERAEGYNPRTGVDDFTGKTIRSMGIMGNFGAAGAKGAAALSTTGATHPVTTSTTSNEMHTGDIHIHGVDTNNTDSVAGAVTGALKRSWTPAFANTGLA